ncbi:helix-turn-helix domain-containing protein [Actinotalea sp. M2MS4P-6]|uniref:helix-turn-helix transcriptional regulator n=1 Tax=Actinotalea sp. M2MS4P-6 TaxID=2983762 RepID=UPI0021E44D77|nr:helix-turn-helix domain-containing protein [Actinotalea sp. M2MS4P-6]MCV2395856.1 helix-turn-helix domain-containing protein [Actinotalea sp. M2MS4P-6]
MQPEWDEHQALASRSRTALLELLRGDGGAMGVDELADAVGLHVNTTREHLDRLVAAGLVSRAPEHRTTRGRPRILYRHREPAGSWVRTVMDEVLLAGFGQPMPSASDGAQAAGRAAVEALDHPMPTAADADEAVTLLVDELDRLGFDVELEGDAVRLCQCPVESLARSRPDVVCAAHLGMTSALVERIGKIEIADAQPFADETSCLIRLRARAD